MDTLTVSIGLGLAVSALFSEWLGLAAGGMIVPGYLALSLNQPRRLLLTVLAALLTHAIGRGAGAFIILYGRRRTVLLVLVGFLSGAVLTRLSPSGAPGAEEVVGHIIPGLLAIWFDRQGVFETLTTAAIAAVLVRLLLVLALGGGILHEMVS